jgi:hypothetical protein
VDKRNGYKLTEEECLDIDGHCYGEETITEWTEHRHYRTCKHCGHRQAGREQPRIVWQDFEERWYPRP